MFYIFTACIGHAIIGLSYRYRFFLEYIVLPTESLTSCWKIQSVRGIHWLVCLFPLLSYLLLPFSLPTLLPSPFLPSSHHSSFHLVQRDQPCHDIFTDNKSRKMCLYWLHRTALLTYCPVCSLRWNSRYSYNHYYCSIANFMSLPLWVGKTRKDLYHKLVSISTANTAHLSFLLWWELY